MPVYNSASTLRRAVQSIFAQTREDWELCIVNDASTDTSKTILNELANQDSRIRVEHFKENQGAGAARNQAMSMATGRFIAFLDADDEWFKAKLEKQVGWMESERLPFTCTAYERWRYGKKTAVTKVPPKADYNALLHNNTVGTLTAVYDRKVLGTVFMPIIRRRQDYALWLELLTQCDYVFGLDEPLAKYHAQENSLSSNKLVAAKAQWYFFRKVLNMSFLKSCKLFISYAYHALKRNK